MHLDMQHIGWGKTVFQGFAAKAEPEVTMGIIKSWGKWATPHPIY